MAKTAANGEIHYGWLVKIAVFTLIMVQMTQSLCNPSLAGIMAQFPGEATTTIQTIINIPTLVMIFSSLVVAPMCHKFGYKTTGIIAMLFALIGGVLPGFYYPSVAVMIAERAIFGIGYGMVYALSIAAAGEFWRDKETTQMVGLITLFCGLAGIFYNLIAAAVVGGGWQHVYFVFFAIIIYLVYYAIFMPQHSELPGVDVASREASKKSDWSGLGAKYWEYIVAMMVALASMAVFMNNIAMVVVGTGIDVTGAAIGIIMTGFSVGLMLGGPVYIALYRTIHRLTMPLLLLCDAICFTIIMVNPTYMTLMVTATIIGIVFGGVCSGWSDMGNKKVANFPAASALGASLFIAGSGVSQFLSPYMMAGLAGIFGQTQTNPFYQYYPAIAIIGIGAIVLIILSIMHHNKVDYEHDEVAPAAAVEK